MSRSTANIVGPLLACVTVAAIYAAAMLFISLVR